MRERGAALGLRFGPCRAGSAVSRHAGCTGAVWIAQASLPAAQFPRERQLLPFSARREMRPFAACNHHRRSLAAGALTPLQQAVARVGRRRSPECTGAVPPGMVRSPTSLPAL